MHDITIIGGGIVGLTLAAALAQRTTLSIAIINNKPLNPDWNPQTHQPRVSAITLASARILAGLNVWPEITAARVSPFTDIHVWDNDSSSALHFNGRDIAEPVLGYIVENNLLQKTLLQTLTAKTGVVIHAPVTLSSLSHQNDAIELRSVAGDVFRSRLVIGADGGHSWLREAAGIAVDKHAYAQTAIVVTVKTEQPHQRVARQVFLPTGPLAFLPLVDSHLSSIVWSLADEEANRLLQLDDHNFTRELAAAFNYRLGSLTLASKRFGFPLQHQQAKNYIAERVALVGDAAHLVHPLAGQGVNMGLLDATSLFDVVQEAIISRRDWTSFATLRKYERWRKADNLTMSTSINVIKNVFEPQHTLVRSLRQAGLRTTDHIQAIKRFFMRQAVGNKRTLPSLAEPPAL